MILREMFKQRPIGSTRGSFRSLVALSTPSGPQWTESELESELLKQIAFAPDIYDLLTQPIINYKVDGKRRRYTPDMAVQMHGTAAHLPKRFLIEVKRAAVLVRDVERLALRFKIGRMTADAIGAVFRVLDESHVRTAHLGNVKLLRGHRREEPTEDDRRAADQLASSCPATVAGAINALADRGLERPAARETVERLVAQRLLQVDFTKPFDDETTLTWVADAYADSIRTDPILNILLKAPDGSHAGSPAGMIPPRGIIR